MQFFDILKRSIQGMLRRSPNAVCTIGPSDFDPDTYLQLNPDVAASGANPLEHYLRHGISEGRSYKEDTRATLPENFSDVAYLALNPELHQLSISLKQHYLENGWKNNKRHTLDPLVACFGSEMVSDRPTMLIVSHDASRTGAPILSWNLTRQFSREFNVVVLLLGKGAVLSSFQQNAQATYVYPDIKAYEAVADIIIKEIIERHNIQWAVVNSVEASAACRPLTLNGVPSICLIHEFASSTSNLNNFDNAARWASHLIFSTSITRSNAVEVTRLPQFETADVIPQGRCLIPESGMHLQELRRDHPLVAILAQLQPEHRLIIGLGSVCYRKGVDTFIECARLLSQTPDGHLFRFIWVGSGLAPAYEPPYAMLLPDQIARSGLQSVLHIVEDTDDLDTLYHRADLLIISSRLDPLPNVGIDAFHFGIPVVCFDKCSGIAEALKDAGLSQPYVAPFYDVAALADLAWRASTQKRTNNGIQRLKQLAVESFSLSAYARKLSALAVESRQQIATLLSDVKLVQKSGLFDIEYFLGGSTTRQKIAQEQEKFQNIFKYCIDSRQGTNHRKPWPGFHPRAFAEHSKTSKTEVERIPYPSLKDSSQVGSIDGLPKLITTIRLHDNVSSTGLNVALHIHVHYIELLPDILCRIQRNNTHPDLFITATDNAPISCIQELLSEFGLVANDVSRVENKGRNILPLYKTLSRILPLYDIIGHAHTKMSAFHDQSDAIGRWRELVLSNILGSDANPFVADHVFNTFQSDPELCIVFPDDPNLLDWGKNLDCARELMKGRDNSLPRHFEFPVSAMFWARSDYLKNFTELPAMEDFSMVEPVPNDGTVLHAFERLLGALLADSPSRIGLTYTPGIYR